jgi:3-hydroxyisobutyrate dehydrogenase-like beta-hydroxyacid dehydrogenase
LAAEVDVGLPLMSVVKALFDDFSAAGEGGSDPAKLFLHLRGGAGPGASA